MCVLSPFPLAPAKVASASGLFCALSASPARRESNQTSRRSIAASKPPINIDGQLPLVEGNLFKLGTNRCDGVSGFALRAGGVRLA